jgi:hypothetical protein
MDIIRYATPEECEQIAPVSDITNASSVITFGGKDFAVVRNCLELDPVIFHQDTTDKRKALFLMNLETALRVQGIKEIYFEAPADDERYLSVLRNWGAVDRTDKPQIRFKKVL